MSEHQGQGRLPSDPPPSVSKIEAAVESLIIMGVFLAAAGMGLTAAWLTGASILAWLKTGVWAHPSIIEVIEPWGGPAPTFEWVMVQRASTWLLDLPAGLVIFIACACLCGVVTRWEAEITERERLAKLRR